MSAWYMSSETGAGSKVWVDFFGLCARPRFKPLTTVVCLCVLSFYSWVLFAFAAQASYAKQEQLMLLRRRRRVIIVCCDIATDAHVEYADK